MKSIRRVLALASLAVCSVALSGADKELNLFAWSEYVPAKVIEGFTKETGIKVNYETFASGEEMLAKLLAGGAAYDLIQPPDYMAETMIKNGLLAPIDFSRVPNMANLAPEFLRLPHDPAQKFTVPYMAGTVGIVVNTERIKTPIMGYADVFQPRHKNRIVVVNDNRELITWALYVAGGQTNEINAASIAKARPILARWIPLIKVFDSDSPKTALLNGDCDLGIVWSGEAALLYNENKKFVYVLPVEGAHRFVDLMAIPKGAPNPAAATLFIDYVLRPEVSKLISDAFPYTNPNAAARKLLSAEQLANPASYPPGAPVLGAMRAIGKEAAQVDKLVTDLKSAR